MKLQLTKTQSTRFASMLPAAARRETTSCTPGSDWALTRTARQIMEIFAQHRHDPFTRRDVSSVLLVRGWTKKMVHENPGYAALSEALHGVQNGGRRGYYTQEHKLGWAVTWAPAGPLIPDPAVPAAPAAPAPVTAKPVTQYEIVVAQKAGVSWTPSPAPETEESWYDLDAGLRRLALSSAKCFGYYEPSDAACKACPLAGGCSNQVLANMEAVALVLDTITAETLAAAEREVAVAAAEALRQEALAANPPPNPSAPAPSAPVDIPLVGSAWPKGFNPLTDPLPWAGICSGCNSETAVGSQVIHVGTGGNQGMYHEACARRLAGI